MLFLKKLDPKKDITKKDTQIIGMVKLYNFNFQIIYYKINEYNEIKRQSQDKIDGYDKKVCCKFQNEISTKNAKLTTKFSTKKFQKVLFYIII